MCAWPMTPPPFLIMIVLFDHVSNWNLFSSSWTLFSLRKHAKLMENNHERKTWVQWSLYVHNINFEEKVMKKIINILTQTPIDVCKTILKIRSNFKLDSDHLNCYNVPLEPSANVLFQQLPAICEMWRQAWEVVGGGDENI